MDDDVHSDISMPPLELESDLEYEEDHLRYGGYDSISDSDADAYDVEMTLLVDDGDPSDDEGFALPNEITPPLPSTSFTADRNRRHVVVEEVEDQDQQRTGECVAYSLFIMTWTLTLCQTLLPWRAAGSLAHHHTSGLTHIGTLFLILTSTPTPIRIHIHILSNTRIYLIHHTPMVMFASPTSRACLVFVRKARLRVKFLYRASELSFNRSL
jgi:hypothetical protein